MADTTEEMNNGFAEKDEYGLYIHADNYQESRSAIIAMDKNHSEEKLNRIPLVIRWIFGAL